MDELLLDCKKTEFVLIESKSFPRVDGEIDYVNKEDIGIIRSGVFRNDRSIVIPHVAIGKYPVTRELYKKVTDYSCKMHNLKLDVEPSSWKNFIVAMGEESRLVACENVNWYDCILFCNSLSELCLGRGHEHYIIEVEELKDGHIINAFVEEQNNDGFRLLTEIEWEYCSRGGDPESDVWRYPIAGCKPDKNIEIETVFDSAIAQYAWFNNDSYNPDGIVNKIIRKGDRFVQEKIRRRKSLGIYGPHEVGKKKPNSLGIYDMSGNVHEWVWDIWDNEIKNEKKKLSTPFVEGSRCMRGGGWPNKPIDLIVTSRWALPPSYYATIFYGNEYSSPDCTSDVGFRICRTL